MNTDTDEGAGRWVIATGLPGYGPDASDDNFSVADTWTGLADVIASELDELAEYVRQGAEAYADQEDYRLAWLTMKESEALSILAQTFDNKRMNAPLYKDDAPAWYATVHSLITEHFAYDVTDNLRMYVWPDEEFGADEDSEGETS